MKKKALLLLVAFALLLSAFALVGCGKKAETPEPAAPGGEPAAELPAAVQAVKDSGSLRVGVKPDVPNFGYKDPATNEFEGFEIDLAKRIAKEIFGDESKVTFEPVTAKTRGPLLDNGQLDMVIATFTIKPERLEQWNFTTPYFTDEVGLLVKKSAGINKLEDLAGKKIGVAQGATSKDALQALADERGIKDLNFLEFATYPEINAALESGRIDAFSVDKSILTGYLSDDKFILDEGFSPQDYGIALKKGNDELTKFVQDLLDELKASGEMDTMLGTWGLN